MTKLKKKLRVVLGVFLVILVGIGLNLKPYQKERISNLLSTVTSNE